MEHPNGATPPQVIARDVFDQLNRLTEQLARTADSAILYLRGEDAPGFPSADAHAIADDLDQICEAIDHFRDHHGIVPPDLTGEV